MKNTLRKSMLLILMTGFMATSNLSLAQSASRFSYHKYDNGKGDTLNYRLLFPDYSTLHKYPLVIFLHGSKDSGVNPLYSLDMIAALAKAGSNA